jgi:glycosyltransferase involved in cell wall biosynthesis
MNKTKIAIIVQRYGVQINGGAEVHARMIAEKLNEKYDVTVLTSCALDYHTWLPELKPGVSYENNVRIHRFANEPKGNRKQVHKLNRRLRGRQLHQKLYRFLKRPEWFLKLFPGAVPNHKDEVKWLALQGPAMPKMITYLKTHEHDYAAYIFFTYLYYPTAVGLVTVPHKSIFIPTMHDEPPAYFPIFRKVMERAEWLLFNTPAEQRFSEKLFNIGNSKKKIVAVGIDPVPEGIDKGVPLKFNIKGPYMVYVGRIDVAKGCDVMIEHFKKYLADTKSALKLVLVGKNMMEAKPEPSIIFTGFVTDEEKVQLIKQANALIIPSIYESLSLVLLESFACRVPVIANGNCEVLKDHIDLSDGGWNYFDYEQFRSAVNDCVTQPQHRAAKAENGYRYVTQNYTWDKVLEHFDEAIEDVASRTKYTKS